MGSSMEFDGYSPEEIKKGVVQYFNEQYEDLGDKIVYVNPAYKIGTFYKLSTRYAELTKMKMILAMYKEGGEFTDEQMKEFAESETAPEDYPRVKKGLFSSKPADSEATNDELKEVEGQIAEFEKHASSEADPDEQEEAFTGIVFIIF